MARERIAHLADESISIAEVRGRAGDAELGDGDRGVGIYVLEGVLVLRFEDREVRAGPETWAFVPPNVSYASVAGGEGARFLEIHVAGSSASAIVRNGAAAEAVEVSGNRIAYLADADETGGALGAIEFTAPRAFAGPPPHVHRGFHDVVFVLEGTIDVVLGEEAYAAGEGAFVHAPPGVAHTFSNPSDAPLRFLNLYVPGGFERFFRERAAATAAGVELTSRYDWERA